MADNTYESLAEMWKGQRERFDEWRHSLTREAHALRNAVASKLGGPERWESHDGKEQRRYVEIIDLSVATKPVGAAFAQDAITDEGELYFGIQVTFDHGVNTYPKTLYHIPAAIRFHSGQAQFSFWDTQSHHAEGSSWLSDRDAIASQVVERLVRHLSFDPFAGASQRPSIGFVKS